MGSQSPEPGVSDFGGWIQMVSLSIAIYRYIICTNMEEYRTIEKIQAS